MVGPGIWEANEATYSKYFGLSVEIYLSEYDASIVGRPYGWGVGLGDQGGADGEYIRMAIWLDVWEAGGGRGGC